MLASAFHVIIQEISIQTSLYNTSNHASHAYILVIIKFINPVNYKFKSYLPVKNIKKSVES